MKWSLVVPGALVPPALAPELASAIRAPQLAIWLAKAKAGPEVSAGEHNAGAPHWTWLARAFGMDTDPPVTAPYAWQASGDPDSQPQTSWIAHCDPVHMAIARDHLVVTDFGDAPLAADEAQRLFTLANEVVCDTAGDGSGAGGRGGAGLRFECRGDKWFLLSDQGLQIQTHCLDAVLGQSVHERMPTGPDARRWRILANDIQMLWHASSVNQAREERNARPANALWIHGAGRWRALPPGSITQLCVEPATTDHAILRGWMLAAAANHAGGALGSESALAGGDTVSVCRDVFDAFANQSWDAWLHRLSALEARLEQDTAAARRGGVQRFELVLCGARQARTAVLPLQAQWWRWPRGAPRTPAPLLARWLGEAADSAAGGRA